MRCMIALRERKNNSVTRNIFAKKSPRVGGPRSQTDRGESRGLLTRDARDPVAQAGEGEQKAERREHDQNYAEDADAVVAIKIVGESEYCGDTKERQRQQRDFLYWRVNGFQEFSSQVVFIYFLPLFFGF